MIRRHLHQKLKEENSSRFTLFFFQYSSEHLGYENDSRRFSCLILRLGKQDEGHFKPTARIWQSHKGKYFNHLTVLVN